ncbi:MAG TPA: polysaccharide deacetylase family protein, partial [Bacillaceae bacterium]
MKTKNLLGFGLIAILSMSAAFNPYTSLYVEQLKSGSIQAAAAKSSLYKQIEEKAESYYIPPQDARIDRVWKAMPGYNGIEVDVAASYAKMKKGRTYEEKKLVFRQIPPAVHLSDLPPAPIYRGHPEKPMVALLINVAWGEEFLPGMLATLKQHSIHATFFLEGRWAKANP